METRALSAMRTFFTLLIGLFLAIPQVSEAQSSRLVYGEQIRSGGNGTMVVSYNLAKVHQLYTVELQISTDGGESYHPLPQDVTGDVGRSIRPGSDKEIRWNYTEDFPVDFGNGQYSVRVEATRQNRGNESWLVYAGIGVGLAAAGITAGLLVNNGNGNSGGISIPLGRQ